MQHIHSTSRETKIVGSFPDEGYRETLSTGIMVLLVFVLPPQALSRSFVPWLDKPGILD
jgi:hypothetical protein